MAEMHHATPGAGKRLAMHIAIVAVTGVAIVTFSQAYQPQLLEWVTSDPSRTRGRAQMIVAVLGLVVVAPLIGLAVYVWRLGTRTLNEERFPPEGLIVLRDMLVVRGAEARSRGRVFRAFSVAFLVVAGLLMLILWRLATLSARP
jgi:hypothetical protein